VLPSNAERINDDFRKGEQGKCVKVAEVGEEIGE